MRQLITSELMVYLQKGGLEIEVNCLQELIMESSSKLILRNK